MLFKAAVITLVQCMISVGLKELHSLKLVARTMPSGFASLPM